MYRELFFNGRYFFAVILYYNLSSVFIRSTGIVNFYYVYGRSFLDRSNEKDMEGRKC